MGILLQAIPGSESIIATYGPWGLIVIGLATAVRFLYMRVSRRQDESEAELKQVRADFKKYIEEDRAEMLEVIRNNTRVIEKLLEK